LSTSRYAVTGGAGFIGAALANRLGDLGFHNLLLMDNLSTGDWSRLNYQFIRDEIDLSITSIDELSKKLDGVECLFHLSAVKLHNEKNSFEDIFAHNINATQKLFEAAGRAGVKSIVFTSSLYVYGLPDCQVISEDVNPRPTTIYGASKLLGENLLEIASKKFLFNYSIARLFFIYGEKQYSLGGYKSVIVNNFERIKSDKPALINGDGEQVLDYLHVDDCVEALILLSESPANQIVNVSSGVPVSISILTEKMLEVAKSAKTRYEPADWTQGTRRVGSNRKIMGELPWVQRVSLEEGLTRTWDSIK
jgi:UDP-glucose 4-epimerase